MNKNLLLVLFTAVLIVLPACKTQSVAQKKKKKPEWVDNLNSVYNDDYYIANVGIADTRDAAKQRAAAGISERFQTKISVDQTYRQRYDAYIDATGNMTETGVENLDKKIRTVSEQVLVNVAYSDFYTDETGKIFVAAYLDRQKTSTIYTDRIMSNDRSIDQFMSGSKAASDAVERYAYANAAYIVSLNNQMLREQLQVIKQGAAPLTMNTHGEITEARAKAAADVKYLINIEGDVDNKVITKLKEVLTGEGFTIIDSESEAVLTLDTKVGFEKLDLDRKDAIFIGWSVQMSMKDNANTTIFSLAKEGRDGGKNITGAERMSMRTIYKYIDVDFNRELSSYFDGMVLK